MTEANKRRISGGGFVERKANTDMESLLMNFVALINYNCGYRDCFVLSVNTGVSCRQRTFLS